MDRIRDILRSRAVLVLIAALELALLAVCSARRRHPAEPITLLSDRFTASQAGPSADYEGFNVPAGLAGELAVSETFSLDAGIYNVTVAYSGGGPDVTLGFAGTAPRADTVVLVPGRQAITFQAYVPDPNVQGAALRLCGAGSAVTVHSVELVYAANASAWHRLVCLAALLLALDLAWLLATRRLVFAGGARAAGAALAVLGIALAASLPLAVPGLPLGGDLMFQLARMQNALESLQTRRPPAAGWDSALFLYPAAALRLFGISVQGACKAYAAALNLLTAGLAWACLRRLTADRRLALICCALYTLSPWRLSLLYAAGRLDLAAALAFASPALCGLYALALPDQAKKPLPPAAVLLGFAGVLYSDTAFFFALCAVGVPFCLSALQKRRLTPAALARTALLLAGLAAGVLLPLAAGGGFAGPGAAALPFAAMLLPGLLSLAGAAVCAGCIRRQAEPGRRRAVLCALAVPELAWLGYLTVRCVRGNTPCFSTAALTVYDTAAAPPLLWLAGGGLSAACAWYLVYRLLHGRRLRAPLAWDLGHVLSPAWRARLDALAARLRAHPRRLLTAYAVLLLALNLPFLLDRTFWLDEVYSWELIHNGWAAMVAGTVADVHPPLYYLLLKGACELFGYRPLVLRLVALVPTVLLAAAAVFWFAPQFGSRAAALFLTCLALTPYAMRTNAEVRMYSWALLFVTVCGYAMHKVLTAGRRRDAAMLVAAGLAAAYTHYFAFLAVAALYLALLLALPAKRRVRVWLPCFAVSMLGYLPWLGAFLSTLSRTTGDFWLTAIPSLSETLSILYGDGPSLVLLAAAAVLTAVYLVRCRTHAAWPFAAAAVLTAAVLLGVGYGASVLVRPLFLSRYFYPACGLLWLAAGIAAQALTRDPARLSRWLLAAVLLCSGWVYLRQVRELAETNRAVDQSVAYVAEHCQPGDRLVSTVGMELREATLALYFPEADIRAYTPDAWLPPDGAGSVFLFTPPAPDGLPADLQAAVDAAGCRVADSRNLLLGSQYVDAYYIVPDA